MRPACLHVLLCLSTGLFASIPVGAVLPVEPPVPVDCSSIIDFLDDEVMTLSHTASFGETCVTIETLVHFGTDGVAEELDHEGNVLGTFAYTVTEVDGQCALASTASDCEVQLLSFNGDESAMIMSLNGAEATLTPTSCPFAPELGDVSVTSGATALANADGALSVQVTGGTPVSIELSGINGSQDQSFPLPGDVDGVLAGYYNVTALDADDCESEAVTVMVPYDLCCDCGVSDTDSDGICDDADNCTDKSASNYADPANTPCFSTLACAAPAMDGYDYDVVQIGGQCWFAENLRTTVYADGEAIVSGLTDADWSATGLGATAIYGEGQSSCWHSAPLNLCDEAVALTQLGRLYNRYAVLDSRGLCPAGWRVPSDADWSTMEGWIEENYQEGVAKILKSSETWYNSGSPGLDLVGFGAKAGGTRYNTAQAFDHAGHTSDWWSSVGSGRTMQHDSDDVDVINYPSTYGHYVRCMKDVD